MSLPDHALKLFIRDRKRRPRGMIIAIKSKTRSNAFSIGWSMQHRKLDVYDEKVGQEIALTRAADADKLLQEMLPANNLPYDVRHALDEFRARCENYYKTKRVVIKAKKAKKA